MMTDPLGSAERSPLYRFVLNPNATLGKLVHTAATFGLHVGLPVVAGVLLVLVARSAVRRAQARRLAVGGRFVEILVPPDVDPAGAESLWAVLLGLLRPAWRRWLEGQVHVTFEYMWSIGGVRIGMWVPRAIPPGMVERAVEAAWPGCRTRTDEPGPPLPVGAITTGGQERLWCAEWYPLRTEHDADPLRGLFGAAVNLDEGEAVAVQIAARPLTGRRVRRGLRAARAIRQGRPISLVGRVIDLLLPGPRQHPRAADDPSLARDIRLILEKAAQQAYEVHIRYGAATTRQDAMGKGQLRGRAHAVASAFSVYGGRNGLRRGRLRRPEMWMHSRRMKRGDLLSVRELAALAHLPSDVAVPGLVRAGARVVAPSPAIPSTGKVLGDAQVGATRPVAIAVEDARHHLHIVGKTGAGKSTLLVNLVLGDVAAGRGVVVIDPAGDLVNDILDRLPAEAADRVVILDPEDASAPPIMNVLDGADPELAVDNLVGIFRRIFEQYWGPRTDDTLRSACLTLLRREGATLAQVPQLLADADFRRDYVAAVAEDKVGLGGFWAWYEAMPPALQSQVVGPVLNKLRAFLLRDFARQVVGRPRSSFNIGQILDGGICLARLPKAMGEDSSRLLGSFLVAQVWQAAAARARLAPGARRPATLVVDEFHNYINLPRAFDEMLAEARKYNLSLVLAHQNLAQLPTRLRDGVSANARNKVFYTVSPEDAHELRRHMEPTVTEHDLANLAAFQAVARLVVAGEDTQPFTLASRPAPPPVQGRARQVRAVSRRRHGRRDAKRRVTPEEAGGALVGARRGAA